MWKCLHRAIFNAWVGRGYLQALPQGQLGTPMLPPWCCCVQSEKKKDSLWLCIIHQLAGSTQILFCRANACHLLKPAGYHSRDGSPAAPGLVFSMRSVSTRHVFRASRAGAPGSSRWSGFGFACNVPVLI